MKYVNPEGAVRKARGEVDEILSKMARGARIEEFADEFFHAYVLIEKAIITLKLKGSVESLEEFEKPSARPEELIVEALDLLDSALSRLDEFEECLKDLRGARNRLKSVLILLRASQRA